MTANLMLSISREDAKKPYKFKATGINVYSFEETLYHCHVYWKQSIDDFLSDELINWVKDELHLSFIASKIREAAAKSSFAERLTAFLSIADYISPVGISELKAELAAWESRLEWEKLKERGDDMMNSEEPEKAFLLYKRALAFAENLPLLNNAGIALMKLGRFAEAAVYLNKAAGFEPDNMKIMTHLAEAYVLGGDYDSALEVLKKAETLGESADIYFLYGEIKFITGNALESISLYEKAIDLCPDSHYFYRLADVYVKLRLYERAHNIMEKVAVKDKYFLKKQAELYVKTNNIPAAIKCIEKAISTNHSSADLWAKLAAYRRMDYDFNKAYSAIITSMGIDASNKRASLEYARIRKAQGQTRNYQVILNGVLSGIKDKYRENADFEHSESTLN